MILYNYKRVDVGMLSVMIKEISHVLNLPCITAVHSIISNTRSSYVYVLRSITIIFIFLLLSALLHWQRIKYRRLYYSNDWLL
jgi:hypothetical protein